MLQTLNLIDRDASQKLRNADVPEGQIAVISAHATSGNQFATKDDISASQLALRNDINALRLELKNDIGALRTSMKDDIHMLRLELGRMEKRLIRWIILLLVISVLLTLAGEVLNHFLLL